MPSKPESVDCDGPMWPLPAAQVVCVGACAAVLWLLIRGVATPGNELLLVLPVVATGLVLVEAGDPRAVLGAVRASVWLVVAFLACTLPWYAALSAVAGWQVTFDAIFVAGARTAWAFWSRSFGIRSLAAVPFSRSSVLEGDLRFLIDLQYKRRPVSNSAERRTT